LTRAAARLALLALLAGASAAGAQPNDFTLSRAGQGLALLPGADPSAIVAAEMARAKLAREQGAMAGLRKTADKDAVLFVPGIVNAQSWLKKRGNAARVPSGGMADRVFMSCDGGYGVALGHVARPDGGAGGYVTLWRRQNDGSFKWLLDWTTSAPTRDANANANANAGEDVDADALRGVEGKVADCPARRGPGAGADPNDRDPRRDARRAGRARLPIVRIADPPPPSGAGQSVDGTLRWQWETQADGARALTVAIRYGGADLILLDDRFASGTP